MTTVSATNFKAKCLALIDEMNRTLVPIVVTNRGKPVATMYPAASTSQTEKPFIGLMKDSVKSFQDPFTPVLNDHEWDALQ
jgi:prevent-host-death family protein